MIKFILKMINANYENTSWANTDNAHEVTVKSLGLMPIV